MQYIIILLNAICLGFRPIYTVVSLGTGSMVNLPKSMWDFLKINRAVAKTVSLLTESERTAKEARIIWKLIRTMALHPMVSMYTNI